MAQFVSFSPSTEVQGALVLNFIHTLPYKSEMESFLADNGFKDPLPQQWYSLQSYLNVYREIAKNYGPNTLFSIGKMMIENFGYLSKVKDLETAVKALNEFYKNNHRGGEVGYYQIINVDLERKEIKVECKNPYPCYLDRGMLTALTKKFKPNGASVFNVELDTNRPNRLIGSDVSVYTIMWS